LAQTPGRSLKNNSTCFPRWQITPTTRFKGLEEQQNLPTHQIYTDQRAAPEGRPSALLEGKTRASRSLAKRLNPPPV
jgi:hypothetical protein